jgi:hypothetical protein
MTHTSKTGAHAILTGSEAFWQSTFLNPLSSHKSPKFEPPFERNASAITIPLQTACYLMVSHVI